MFMGWMAGGLRACLLGIIPGVLFGVLGFFVAVILERVVAEILLLFFDILDRLKSIDEKTSRETTD